MIHEDAGAFIVRTLAGEQPEDLPGATAITDDRLVLPLDARVGGAARWSSRAPSSTTSRAAVFATSKPAAGRRPPS